MDKQNRSQGVHTKKVRQRIFSIYRNQALVLLLLAVGLYIGLGRTVAISSVAGGLVYLIPNLYFAQRALKHSPGATARRVLAEMYISEIWKMVLTAVLFAAVFVLVKPLSPFSLFGTYILLQLIGSVWQARLRNGSRKL